MNLDVWNNPPLCERCKRRHWRKDCDAKGLGAHERFGDNGDAVTIIAPPTVEEKNKPDWQGTSRQTPKENQTEVLKERY